MDERTNLSAYCTLKEHGNRRRSVNAGNPMMDETKSMEDDSLPLDSLYSNVNGICTMKRLKSDFSRRVPDPLDPLSIESERMGSIGGQYCLPQGDLIDLNDTDDCAGQEKEGPSTATQLVEAINQQLLDKINRNDNNESTTQLADAENVNSTESVTPSNGPLHCGATLKWKRNNNNNDDIKTISNDQHQTSIREFKRLSTYCTLRPEQRRKHLLKMLPTLRNSKILQTLLTSNCQSDNAMHAQTNDLDAILTNLDQIIISGNGSGVASGCAENTATREGTAGSIKMTVNDATINHSENDTHFDPEKVEDCLLELDAYLEEIDRNYALTCAYSCGTSVQTNSNTICCMTTGQNANNNDFDQLWQTGTVAPLTATTSSLIASSSPSSSSSSSSPRVNDIGTLVECKPSDLNANIGRNDQCSDDEVNNNLNDDNVLVSSTRATPESRLNCPALWLSHAENDSTGSDVFKEILQRTSNSDLNVDQCGTGHRDQLIGRGHKFRNTIGALATLPKCKQQPKGRFCSMNFQHHHNNLLTIYLLHFATTRTDRFYSKQKIQNIHTIHQHRSSVNGPRNVYISLNCIFPVRRSHSMQ